MAIIVAIGVIVMLCVVIFLSAGEALGGIGALVLIGVVVASALQESPEQKKTREIIEKSRLKHFGRKH